ncbi:MAG: hypothetical protein AB9886_02030 [Candidatus Cryosericum sp.]
MKSIARQATRWLLLVVLAFALGFGSGCGPKPITKATLDYFYGLANQQYWQSGTDGLTLDDEYGTKQVVIAPAGTSDKQSYLAFEDVTVTGSDPKVGPIDAVIKVKVFDGTIEKDVRVRVDDANLATLQSILAVTFESKAQRDERLKNEKYAAKLKEADALLAANKVAAEAARTAAAKAVAEKAAAKAASEKEAADKATAQRRAWFKTLDEYYRRFDALAVEMGVQNSYTMMPTADKMKALNDEIHDYCFGAPIMTPPDLQDMGTALWAYTGGEMTQIYRFMGGISVDEELLVETEQNRAEFLRLRANLVDTYGS